FAFWQIDESEVPAPKAIPYNSVHAAHALVRAKEAGVPFDWEKHYYFFEGARRYLQDLVNSQGSSTPGDANSRFPSSYSPSVCNAIKAYAFYVLNLMKKQSVSDSATPFVESIGIPDLSLEALAWILPVVHPSQ